MGRLDFGVARGMGPVLGFDDDVAGAGGEPVEPGGRVQGRGVGGSSGDEALLGGLFRDAHALPDLGPRCAGAAGLVHEMADQMVGDIAERLGGEHRVGELFQRFGVHGGDRVDEVVEADGVVDGDGLAHGSTLG